MVVELTRSAGYVVQDYADSDYPEKDRELVQHSMEVTNELLRKVQDGELTTTEMIEASKMIKRFVQVWLMYENRVSDEYRSELTDVLSEVESFL